MNGRVYCAECLRCPHGMLSSQVCPLCVRALYSRATFAGWRIVDLEVYARDAWRDYGLRGTDTPTWAFHEMDALLEKGEAWVAKEAPHDPSWRVRLPPPHHRVTPWDGSR